MSVWTRPLRAALAALVVAAGLTAAPQGARAADPPPSPNVHVFYYSWYGNPAVHGQYRHWQQGGHTPPADVGANLYPKLGAYDSGDYAGAVAQHMQWIRQSGAGVLVYSWWGQGSYEDNLAAGVLAAAAAQGLKVAWHLEPYAGRTAASTVADINYLNTRYGASPAYYRDAAHGNRPAFYVFESLLIADWSPIAPLKSSNIVLAQTTDTSKVAHFGGMYTYDGIAGSTAPGWANASAFCKANGLIWAPSVAPGYLDDRAVPGNTTPTVGRANGATYDLQWNNALNPATGGLPDWVSITSFNEWHEGSSIEPAHATPPAGFGYQTFDGAYGLTGAAAETAYLTRTRYWATEFANRSGPGDVVPPTVPGNLTVTGKTATSVSLSWSASTDNVGVVGYTVYQELGAVDNVVASPGGTSVTLNGLTPATTYSYYVRARDAAGAISGPSNTVTVTTDPPAPTVNVALNRPVVASSTNGGFPPGNAVDGNAGSYWESANNIFPQTLSVDLGGALPVTRIALKLPPSWGARTQRIAVHGSTDGVNWQPLSAAADRLFDPAAANTVNVALTSAAVRHVRLTITTNTGWPAGQISEFEVYGGGTVDTQPPSVPGNLTVTGKTQTAVSLSWTASTDNVGVTGYRVLRNGTQFGTASGTAFTASGLAPGSTHTFTVAAQDAAGLVSGPSNAVTVTTDPAGNVNLAAGKPTTESGHVQSYGSGNITDGNRDTYWESPNNAWPQWAQVDLGSSLAVSRLVLKLPAPAAWATRNQTLSVLGSDDGMTWRTLVPSATYTFNPGTGNTVTITFTVTPTRYLRVVFTGNTGWPAGQLSELEAYTS
ncbi:discoidin domain-containing protein [Catellatospora sichuanensis]|uniref:discoidin domain-containing protein n=1 Tax=Catellatospora sichuanensis TaxID=1969805 RepID=UPI001181F828|nr:discoidin domain-containing protein [Catellatospora sichuanensis]